MVYFKMSASTGLKIIVSASGDNVELNWHCNHLNRRITIGSGEGWSIQLDQGLPRLINHGDIFEIPAGEYYRLIAGNEDLELMVFER